MAVESCRDDVSECADWDRWWLWLWWQPSSSGGGGGKAAVAAAKRRRPSGGGKAAAAAKRWQSGGGKAGVASRGGEAGHHFGQAVLRQTEERLMGPGRVVGIEADRGDAHNRLKRPPG